MINFEQIYSLWSGWILSSSWQLALLVILVGIVAFSARKFSPRWRYALWLLVLIKVFIPPSLTLSLGVGQWGIMPILNRTNLSLPAINAPRASLSESAGEPETNTVISHPTTRDRIVISRENPDFNLSESNLIREFAFPYSLFSYKVKWVNLVLEKKLVLDEKTESFYIFLDPEARQYKGIYFHYNKDPKIFHSFVGKFGKDFRELTEREWGIRAHFEKTDLLPKKAYLVSLKPSPSFKPGNARQLLKKFNEILPQDIIAENFRFEEAGENLISAIRVYGKAEKDRVKEILNQSEELEYVQEKKFKADELSPGTNIKIAEYKKAANEDKPSPPLKGRPWGTEQATGAPDTKEAGDIKTAWAPLSPDDQDEWLLLEYETAVIPSRIDIYETYNPGAVNRVTVFNESGEEVEVWKGEDPTAPNSGKGISQIPVNIDFITSKLKIYIDSKNVPGWNEIDAVGLIDQEGKTQWAKKAEASSTFAER